MRALLVAIPLLSAAPLTHATIITISASDFAHGEVITGPGVSMRGIVAPVQPMGTPTQLVLNTTITAFHGEAPGLVPTMRFSGGWSYIGDTVHCYNRFAQGQAPGTCNEGWSVLEISFDTPTDYFEVIGGFGDSLGPAFLAFNQAGQVIGGCNYSTPLSQCTNHGQLEAGAYRLSATLDQELISRIWYGNSNIDRVAISSFSYSVPEPSTLALLGTALIGAALRRRRSLATNI